MIFFENALMKLIKKTNSKRGDPEEVIQKYRPKRGDKNESRRTNTREETKKNRSRGHIHNTSFSS
jgi:hypothetical protein